MLYELTWGTCVLHLGRLCFTLARLSRVPGQALDQAAVGISPPDPLHHFRGHNAVRSTDPKQRFVVQQGADKPEQGRALADNDPGTPSAVRVCYAFEMALTVAFGWPDVLA